MYIHFFVLFRNRSHDFRISLHDCEVVGVNSPLHSIVEQFWQSFTFDASEQSVYFLVRASDWNVHLVRHKKEHTFIVEDNYAVIVADIREYKFYGNFVGKMGEIEILPEEIDNAQYHSEVEVSLLFDPKWPICTMVIFNPHVTPQFHNLAWERAFGGDTAFFPSQCLTAYMERGTENPTVVDSTLHSWLPDDILRDFDGFFESVDDVLTASSSNTNCDIRGSLLTENVVLSSSLPPYNCTFINYMQAA